LDSGRADPRSTERYTKLREERLLELAEPDATALSTWSASTFPGSVSHFWVDISPAG